MPSTSEFLARATQLFRQGNCAEAEAICTQLADTHTCAAEVFRLRGLIALHRQDPACAVRLFEQAVSLEPTSAEYHDLLGTAYREAGDSENAIVCYRTATQHEPTRAQSHQNLGASLFDQGNIAEAITCLEFAIKLDSELAAAHYNLGNARQAEQDFDRAAACYEAALAIDENYGQAHANLGAVLFAKQEYERAQTHFEQACELLPESAEVHNNLAALRHQQGNAEAAIKLYQKAVAIDAEYADAAANLADALIELQRFDQAAKCLEKLIALLPDSAEAHNNLGIALQRDQRLDEAISSYKRAIDLQADFADAISNLATAYWEAGDLNSATLAFERAITLNPDLVAAHVGRANVLQDSHRFDEAMASYDHAIALAPENSEARFARGLLLLRQGDFENGWRDYEARWQTDLLRTRDLPARLWHGESLEGQSILIHAEQGLGDTIQFARYLPLVKASGGRVIFAARERLKRLLRDAPGVDYFVALGKPMPRIDVHAPLLSLPHIFQTTLDNIPGTIPYLRANPNLAAAWISQLASTAGMKIGVCWQGNVNHRRDRVRSMPPEVANTLADVEGVTLISLEQHNPGEEFDTNDRIIDLSETLDKAAGPFMDTAAIMQNLDLVISCDTSIAHLAGAMGVPVWVGLDYAADWRWMHDRSDSPWYPTMQLFRQTTASDWDGVIQAMKAALQEMLSNQAAQHSRA